MISIVEFIGHIVCMYFIQIYILKYFTAFKTASGKIISVDSKALEAASLKMKNEEPEEASLALSQTFLPQSMTHSIKKDAAGSNEGFRQSGKSSVAFVDWTLSDSVKFTAKTVYPPAHQLQDIKCKNLFTTKLHFI